MRKRWKWLLSSGLVLLTVALVLYVGPGKIYHKLRIAAKLLEYHYILKGATLAQQIRRDIVAADPVGRYYLALGYTHKDEAIDLMREVFTQQDQVFRLSVELFEKGIPLMGDFAEGDGTATEITEEMVQEAQVIAEAFRSKATGELADIIEAELARFPLSEFVGLTPREAWELVRRRGSGRIPGDYAAKALQGEIIQIAKSPSSKAAIAVGPEGTVHIAWLQDDFVRYTTLKGDSISEPEPLGEFKSFGPDIAVDERGTVYLVWTEMQTSDVYYAYKDKKGWSGPIVIESGRGTQPHLTLDKDGRIYVALSDRWLLIESKDASSIKSFEACGLWGLRLGVDGEGNVHLVGLTPEARVGYCVFSDGQPSPIEYLSPPGADLPRLAVSTDGKVHVVWVYPPPGEMGKDIYYVSGRSGIWEEPRRLSYDNLSFWPEIILDKDGNPHIVWHSFSYGAIIYAYLYGDRKELFYLVKGFPEAELPDIAIDDENNSHIVWQQSLTYLPVPEFLEDLGIFYWKGCVAD